MCIHNCVLVQYVYKLYRAGYVLWYTHTHSLCSKPLQTIQHMKPTTCISTCIQLLLASTVLLGEHINGYTTASITDRHYCWPFPRGTLLVLVMSCLLSGAYWFAYWYWFALVCILVLVLAHWSTLVCVHFTQPSLCICESSSKITWHLPCHCYLQVCRDG